jgi:hypothetical protein
MTDATENFCVANRGRVAKHMTYKTEFSKTKEELTKYLGDHAKFGAPAKLAKTSEGCVRGWGLGCVGARG